MALPLRRPSRRTLATGGAALTGALALLAAAGVGAVAWIAVSRALYPQIMTSEEDEYSPAGYPDLDLREVTFPAQDGLPIRAWWIPGERPHTVVVVHGFRWGREIMLPQAALYARAGYSVLVPTLRGSAKPGERTQTSFGYFERLDVRGAVTWARQQAAPAVALHGISMGAAAVLLAAEGDPHVTAVIAEAGYEDLGSLMDGAFEHFLGVPAFPFGPVAMRLGAWRGRLDLAAVRPREAARRLHRPLLLIHGKEDGIIPWQNSLAIYQAASAPRELWLPDRAGHGTALSAEPERYREVVLTFLATWLLGHHPPAGGPAAT